MKSDRKMSSIGLVYRYSKSVEREFVHVDVFVRRCDVRHIEGYDWSKPDHVPCRIAPDKNFRFAYRAPKHSLNSEGASFDITECDDLDLLAESKRRLSDKLIRMWHSA